MSVMYDEESDFLPDGAHLLPQEFQDFLSRWNKAIVHAGGDWFGEGRVLFKKKFPEIWKQFIAENKRLSKLYAKELDALKAYQKLQCEDENDSEPM